MRSIILDVETNTLSTENMEVLQIAYIIIDNFKIKKTYSEYFYSSVSKPIEPEAYRVHGLFREKLFGLANRDFSDFIPELIQEIKLCDSIIGHNVVFDIDAIKTYDNPVLNKKLDELIIEDTCNHYLNYIGVQTYSEGSYFIKCPSLNEALSMLINNGLDFDNLKVEFKSYFPTKDSNFHDAAFDVFVTYKLYIELKRCK